MACRMSGRGPARPRSGPAAAGCRAGDREEGGAGSPERGAACRRGAARSPPAGLARRRPDSAGRRGPAAGRSTSAVGGGAGRGGDRGPRRRLGHLKESGARQPRLRH